MEPFLSSHHMSAIACSCRLGNTVQNASQCADGRRTRTEKEKFTDERCINPNPPVGDPSASESALKKKKNKNMKKKIAVVPYLAYGHMMPLAQLCLKLAAQSVDVTVVCTPRNIPRMKSFLGDDPHTQTIQFAEIALPEVQGLPPGVENTADLQRAEQIMMLVDAAALMKDPLTQLLRHISPDLIIFDGWMPVFAADIGIPTALFVACSFALHALFVHRQSLLPPPSPLPLPPMFDIFEGVLRQRQRGPIQNVDDRTGPVIAAIHECSALIANTCDVLEEPFLDYMTKTDSKAVLAVGPLLPRLNAEAAAAEEEDECAQRCLAWLQNSSSSSPVVYVAFGSEFVVHREDDIREIALGLEDSGVGFLWALRRGRELLPLQFEERVRGRGLVVDEWVPQPQILAHPNVGAFVTHGGWNSVLEGVSAGVPLVTVPMLNHQRFHARVAAAHIKVALEIERDSDGRLYRRDVCDALKRVVLCSEDDDDDGETTKEIVRMKQRVREISSVIRKDVIRPGGSQDDNVRRLVDLIHSFTVSP